MSEVAEETHIPIGHPHQSEECDDISSPIIIQQAEICKNQKQKTDVVAEAIFTSEKIEELPSGNRFSTAADFLAILSRFAENLFLRNRPGNAGNGNGNNEKMQKLIDNIHWFGFND